MAKRIKLNPKFKRFATVPKPIKIAIGGRGSGKSLAVSDILLVAVDLRIRYEKSANR